MPPGSSGFVEPGLSFSPEKTQIELACDRAASFGVRLPGGPITSLAKAALALAPVSAAVQTATASNGFFLRIFFRLLSANAEVRIRPYASVTPPRSGRFLTRGGSQAVRRKSRIPPGSDPRTNRTVN